MFTAYNERRNILVKGLNEIEKLSCYAPEGLFMLLSISVKPTRAQKNFLCIYGRL